MLVEKPFIRAEGAEHNSPSYSGADTLSEWLFLAGDGHLRRIWGDVPPFQGERQRPDQEWFQHEFSLYPRKPMIPHFSRWPEPGETAVDAADALRKAGGQRGRERRAPGTGGHTEARPSKKAARLSTRGGRRAVAAGYGSRAGVLGVNRALVRRGQC